MNKKTARLIVLNVVGAVCAYAAWLYGNVVGTILADQTRISFVIVLGLLLGIFAAFIGRWNTVKWIAEGLPAIGFAATILSACLVLGHTNPDAIGEALRQWGGALAPIFVGIVSYLWLRLLAYSIEGIDF